MSRRTVAFVVFALVLAAGCVRLGFWQLSRLGERRARNAVIAERMRGAATSFTAATSDSATARYRAASASGTYDYEHELVYTSRVRNGAPGIQLLTPMRPAGGGAAILVNRGWVYAADGMSVQLTDWQEGDSARVTGFVEEFTAPRAGPVGTPSQSRGVRRLDPDSVAARIPYPVAAFILVQREGAVQQGALQHPSRLDLPVLDEGSHQSYAIQWFAFAAIAIIGIGAVARRSRGGRPQKDLRLANGEARDRPTSR